MPERIQMTRQRPWRHEHPDAVIVARPSKWGNPIRITPERCEHTRRVMYRVHGSPMDRNGGPAYNDPATARHFAATYFWWDLDAGRWGDRYPSIAEIRAELAGRDLACWCAADSPCHADVLLRVAAGGEP